MMRWGMVVLGVLMLTMPLWAHDSDSLHLHQDESFYLIHEPDESYSIKVPKALLTCLSLRYDREPLRVLPDVRQVALELMGRQRAVLSCGGESWGLELVP